MKKIIVGACVGLLSVWQLAFAAVPEYTAMKAGCRMVMDGFLDEPAWQKAQPVGPFQFKWYESGEKEQTEAKMVWDDERIYFAFKCDDKYISAEHYTSERPGFRRRLLRGVHRSGGGRPRATGLYQLRNQLHRHLESRLSCQLPEEGPGKLAGPRGIEIGRYIKGTVNKDDDIDEGWVLEFSVPWTHFKEFGAKFPPKNGQVMHIGLHRTGGKTNAQHSQWSPSSTEKPQFHSPKDFGKVIISTKVLK